MTPRQIQKFAERMAKTRLNSALFALRRLGTTEDIQAAAAFVSALVATRQGRRAV
jgi:hypothetical protein